MSKEIYLIYKQVIRVLFLKLVREKSRPALLKTQKSLNDNLFLALSFSNKIGFLMRGGVCISMYNTKPYCFLKEKDMPMD